MICNRISRANYSTGVTQEFLQNILARAQEATAKKTATAINKSNSKTKSRYDRSSTQNSSRAKYAGSSRGRGRDGEERTTTGTVASRVKPTFNHSIVNKQPQFKKRTAAGVRNPASGDEMIDAFESTRISNQTRNNKRTANAGTRKNNKNRGVSGSVKRTRDGNDSLDFPPVKARATQEAYLPQEPTPLSLLKFFPNLPNTPSSRLVNYSLDRMKSANFPLFRRANYGPAIPPQGSSKSLTFTLNTPYFGKYTPASSLVFEKEKQIKNLSVVEDKPKFEAAVLGKYHELKALGKNDFKAISKSDKKKEELAFNANIARHSLQGSIPDSEMKETVYQICSGLRSVSEL